LRHRQIAKSDLAALDISVNGTAPTVDIARENKRHTPKPSRK